MPQALFGRICTFITPGSPPVYAVWTARADADIRGLESLLREAAACGDRLKAADFAKYDGRVASIKLYARKP